MVLFQLGSLQKIQQSLVVMFQLIKAFRPVIARLERLRLERDGVVETLLRLVCLPQIEERDTLAYPRIHIIRGELQRLLERTKGGLRVVRFRDTLISHQIIFVRKFAEIFPHLV